MRTLEINLATRPFRNNSLYWAGLGTAAAILAVLSVINIWLFVGYGSAVEQHEQALVTREARTSQLTAEERRLARKLGRLDFPELAKQAEFANGAIRRRIFSWTELFNRMEEVVPPTVMMKGVRPEIQEDGISVLVGGVAKSQEGLLDFEENMIQNVSFARIYPGSERREERGQQLKFFLKFEYVPDAEEQALLAAAALEAEAAREEEGGENPEVTDEGKLSSEAKGEDPGPAEDQTGEDPEVPAIAKADASEAEIEPGEEKKAPVAANLTAPPIVKPTPPAAGEAETKSGEKPSAGGAPVPPKAAVPGGDPENKEQKPPSGDKALVGTASEPASEKMTVAETKKDPPASTGPARDPFREPVKTGAPAPVRVPDDPKTPPPSGSTPPKPETPGATPGTAKSPTNPSASAPPASGGPGVFRDAPVSQVMNYLKTRRSLRFILDGDFDLNLRLTVDLREKTEKEILELLCDTLYCHSERKAHGLYHLTGSSDPRRHSEPAVDEEPLPGDAGAGEEPS